MYMVYLSTYLSMCYLTERSTYCFVISFFVINVLIFHFISIYLSIYLSINLSIYQSINLSIYLI